MRNGFFPIIKLPNGSYIMWDPSNSGLSSLNVLFGLYGIRSPKSSLIMDGSIFTYLGPQSVKRYLESKNMLKFDKLFILLNHGQYGYNIQNVKKSAVSEFGKEIKDILVYDVARWAQEQKIEGWQLQWVDNILYQMARDKRFLFGQLDDRKSLIKYKERIASLQASIEKQQLELKNMTSVDEVQESNYKNIMKMKWIDKIEPAQNNGLRILTKPMSCTFVPNIGRYINIRYIEQSDVLYRIMKYQCLGKYLIVLPDYYIIPNDFAIKADVNTRYPIDAARQIMIDNTYFHGMACHIGNNNACIGELSAAIGQAGKTGLDMLLMSFEAYLRSINLPDAAGQRYFCLPMGDENGNVEVWPFVEHYMKQANVSFKDKERNLQTYVDILSTDKMKGINHCGKPFEGSCENMSSTTAEDNFAKCLKLIEQREPEIYAQIMKRVEEGARL